MLFSSISMKNLYLVLLIFKLMLALESNGKYVLVRITDLQSTFPNKGISYMKGNNITSSRTIKRQRKSSQRSAMNLMNLSAIELLKRQNLGPGKTWIAYISILFLLFGDLKQGFGYHCLIKVKIDLRCISGKLTWTQNMPKGPVSSSSDYCTSMESFQDDLVNRAIKSIKITSGSTTRTCSDSTKANKIVSAFSTCKKGNCPKQTISCGGNIWMVSTCGNGAEISVNNDDGCSCSSDVTIRPCINNNNWGGTQGGCGGNSQTMSIVVTQGR